MVALRQEQLDDHPAVFLQFRRGRVYDHSLGDLRHAGRMKLVAARNFDEAHALGFGVAGTPAGVRAALQRQVSLARVNYLLCRFAFGDMALAESLRSLELFAAHVMPALHADPG